MIFDACRSHEVFVDSKNCVCEGFSVMSLTILKKKLLEKNMSLISHAILIILSLDLYQKQEFVKLIWMMQEQIVDNFKNGYKGR